MVSHISPALRKFLLSPLWLSAPGVLFLGYFFLWPTFQVMNTAVLSSTGALDFSAFRYLFQSAVHVRVMTATFVTAFEVAILCLLIGYPIAYWLSFRSSRSQRVLLMLILLPFWTSALVKNFAWMVILGRNGIASKLMSVLGMKGDTLLYNRWVVLFGIVHTLLPLCVIAMMPVLNQINKNLMAVSSTLGANKAQAFFRIFLPLSVRGLATAWLIVFISTLGFFITPALLGSPRETLIGQLIITQVNELQNLQRGSALGLIILVGAFCAVVVVDRLFGLSGTADRSNSRKAGSRARALGLGIMALCGNVGAYVDNSMKGRLRVFSPRFLLSAYCGIVIMILLLPVVAIVPMAFTSGNFLEFPTPGYSIKWFEAYFTSSVWQAATVRSFLVGFASAILTLVIAATVALGIVRSNSRFSGVIFAFFLSPMIVPTLVIAIGLFTHFANISLLATNIGLVIGHTVIAMPIVFMIVLSTLKGHDWKLDDAARTLGASPLQVARRVTLPLIRTGLVAGAITGFLVSFEELTVALFVTGGLLSTLPKQLWDDIFLQVNPTLAAASAVVLAVVLVFFLLLEFANSRRSTRS